MNNIYSFEVWEQDEKRASVWYNRGTGEIKHKEFTEEICRVPYYRELTVPLLYDFLESRCFCQERPDRDEILSAMGLVEYNPYEIVKVTHGRKSDDSFWLKFNGENLTWSDVK